MLELIQNQRSEVNQFRYQPHKEKLIDSSIWNGMFTEYLSQNIIGDEAELES